MTDCGVIVGRACRLPLEFHHPGTKSIRQLALDAGLSDHRECITQPAVRSHLLAHPRLVAHWLQWSEDKRSSQGWYFFADGNEFVVGYHEIGDKRRLSDPVAACAEFIVREIASILGN